VELTWQGLFAVGIFFAVVLVIVLDLMHMTLAMLLAVSILFLTGVADQEVLASGVLSVIPIISLFVAGMVLVRCLEPTNFFPFLARSLHAFSGGDGRILLVGSWILTSLLCAILPNAIVILLFTPLFIRVARLSDIPPAPLIVFLVLTANTAGLLTMVGGIPSFLVANAMGMSFLSYMAKVGPGALIVLLTLVLIAPFLFSAIWTLRLTGKDNAVFSPSPVRLTRPDVLAALLSILAVMGALFGIGEYMAAPLPPEITAVAGGTAAVAVVHLSRLDHFGLIIRDIDWETIIFFYAAFILIAAMETNGVFTTVGFLLSGVLGTNPVFTALFVATSLALVSCVMPNIPLVAVMIPTMANYLLRVGYLGSGPISIGLEQASGPAEGIMIAMLFGITLGGNITLVGAVPNLVAAGACRKEGVELLFRTFLRYGLPTAALQLAAISGYILFFLL
jgi:Na+/H+ antiporter NhaD/arsenite permease-like protein